MLSLNSLSLWEWVGVRALADQIRLCCPCKKHFSNAHEKPRHKGGVIGERLGGLGHVHRDEGDQ
jgi:hypothetical protein